MQNGVSKLNLKKINRSEILKIIIQNGPTSRIEIAEKINLTRAAITIITNEMISEGILYEKGEEKSKEKSGRGRRKILLDINKNYKFSFGIVFDCDTVYIGLSNLKGEVLDKDISPVDETDIEHLIEKISIKFSEMLRNSSLTASNIIGIGVCVSDDCMKLLNGKDTTAKLNNLKRMLERRLNVRVCVNNTTEGLAIAETMFNTDYKNKASNMVFLRYGYVIDAVVMLNNEIYHKPDSNTNWFPHIVVDTKGDICECGKKGCCKTRMDLNIIQKKILQLYKNGETPMLIEETNGNIENIDFHFENMKIFLSDKKIQQLYEDAIIYLANALDNLMTVLAPEKIVVFDFVFEKILDLDFIINIMKKDHNINFKDRITLSVISRNNIYLAGNGLCVSKLFVDIGGE